MKQNGTFKTLLADCRPDLGDSTRYLSQLQSKLERIETVKRMYEEECHRMRNRMVVAFVSGGVAGAATAFYLLLHPIQLATRGHHLPDWLIDIADNLLTCSTIILLGGLSALTCTLLYQTLKKNFPEASPWPKTNG